MLVPPSDNAEGLTSLAVASPVLSTVMVIVMFPEGGTEKGVAWIEELSWAAAWTVTSFEAFEDEETGSPLFSSVPDALPVRLTVPEVEPAS